MRRLMLCCLVAVVTGLSGFSPNQCWLLIAHQRAALFRPRLVALISHMLLQLRSTLQLRSSLHQKYNQKIEGRSTPTINLASFRYSQTSNAVISEITTATATASGRSFRLTLR